MACWPISGIRRRTRTMPIVPSAPGSRWWRRSESWRRRAFPRFRPGSASQPAWWWSAEAPTGRGIAARSAGRSTWRLDCRRSPSRARSSSMPARGGFSRACSNSPISAPWRRRACRAACELGGCCGAGAPVGSRSEAIHAAPPLLRWLAATRKWSCCGAAGSRRWPARAGWSCSRASLGSASRGSPPRWWRDSPASRTPGCGTSARRIIRTAPSPRLSRNWRVRRASSAATTPEARLGKLEALLAGTAARQDDVALIADLLGLPAVNGGGPPLPALNPQRRRERSARGPAGAVRRPRGAAARPHRCSRMRTGSTRRPWNCWAWRLSASGACLRCSLSPSGPSSGRPGPDCRMSRRSRSAGSGGATRRPWSSALRAMRRSRRGGREDRRARGRRAAVRRGAHPGGGRGRLRRRPTWAERSPPRRCRAPPCRPPCMAP